MTAAYSLLADWLHPVADRVRQHIVDDFGVKNSKIVVEKALAPNLGLRPTFQAPGKDQSVICVEVSDSAYPAQIDAFVIDCAAAGYPPITLWVANPEEVLKVDARAMARARATGVGILSVGASCAIIKPALIMSLAGVRNPEPKGFPSKYRGTVVVAHETFIGGDPVKACSAVYDEIEGVARRLCDKATAKGWWKTKKNGFTTPPVGSDPTQAFKTIATFLHDYFSGEAAGVEELDAYRLGEVVGIVGARNAAGHPAKTAEARRKRDSQLRTRFEQAIDLFRELARAAQRLHL